MTDQQRLFADQYLILNHGTKAAIAAGYSEKSARSQASQLLVIEEIEDYIEQRRKQASAISLVDIAWVQERFKFISDACVQAVPVMVFDPIEKKLVHKGKEDGEPMYEFDASGANTATTQLGKIIGAYGIDNQQKAPKNEIDPSKLSDEVIKGILDASK